MTKPMCHGLPQKQFRKLQEEVRPKKNPWDQEEPVSTCVQPSQGIQFVSWGVVETTAILHSAWYAVHA